MPDISRINETIEEDRINRIRELRENMDRHFEEMHNEITQMKADHNNDITELEARIKTYIDNLIEEAEAYDKKLIEEAKAYDKKLIEEAEADFDNLIEEFEAANKKLINESEARMRAFILKNQEDHKNEIERLEAKSYQPRKDHQNRTTQAKSDEKNNDIANQHTNVKIWHQNPTTPQTIHKLEDKKENNVGELERKQIEAFEKIQSLISGVNKNASTGIINMNNFLNDCYNYSNGKKPTTVDLLNGLKARAKERTSGFFSLPSFSSVSSFFSSFMSFGRKEWVNKLYTALNHMNDPNKLEDVKELLKNLGEESTYSQNVSLSKNT